MGAGSAAAREHPIPPAPPSRRHCWVRGGPGAPGPHPGLIVEWQQRDGTWFALVDYVIEADQVLVQQWLPADLLTRIG